MVVSQLHFTQKASLFQLLLQKGQTPGVYTTEIPKETKFIKRVAIDKIIEYHMHMFLDESDEICKKFLTGWV